MADPNSPITRFKLWRLLLPPALRILLTVNVVVFLVGMVAAILAAFGLALPYQLLEYLLLQGDPGAVVTRPWTPLTYGFTNLIGGPGAIWGIISFAFAMYWLVWLGRDLEQEQGSHGLFGLYVGSVLFGALVALGLAALGPNPLVQPFYMGAWGAATAVLVTVATLHPNRQIGLFLLGVISLKWIAIAFIVLSLLRPDASFLGAALFGFLYAKALQRGVDLSAWARPLFGGRQSRRATPSRASAFSRTTSDTESEPTPRRRRGGLTDVDAILDKILEKGYDSLTKDERAILEREGGD